MARGEGCRPMAKTDADRVASISDEDRFMVAPTSDERTADNVMRHQYRVLDELDKVRMQNVKDHGQAFYNYLETLGSSREISLAKTKIEEAVMWATKSITR